VRKGRWRKKEKEEEEEEEWEIENGKVKWRNSNNKR
jgi:hypothetical protein